MGSNHGQPIEFGKKVVVHPPVEGNSAAFEAGQTLDRGHLKIKTAP
jgi:hypothetical protein